MPLTYTSGDPLLTRAQILCFGHNARARVEVGALPTRLLDLYPAAFATYRKQCLNRRIKPGAFWIWRESQPALGFLVIRESSVGATRVRFVESVVMTLARDYRLHGLTSLALAPLGDPLEWDALRPVVDHWLSRCPLPVVVYEQYIPGVVGE
jgi:hypothetical protein